MFRPQPLLKERVYVIGGNSGIETIFEKEGAKIAKSLDDCSILVFQGGSDVSPDLYKEERHPTTHCNPKRDAYEKACYERGVKTGKLLVGICRGGQFLNVLNGGTMWQDVDNHAISGTHPMYYTTYLKPGRSLERKVDVTSTHHQMMIPDSRGGNGIVWGWAGLSTRKESGIRKKDIDPDILGTDDGSGWFTINPRPGHQSDCEIVYYARTKSLCFQPHPEYNSPSTRELFFTCIERAMAA